MTNLNGSSHERSGEEWEPIHSPAVHCHALTAWQTEQRWCCTQRRHWFLLLSWERFSASLDAQHLYFNVSTPAVGRERRSPEPGWWIVRTAWNAWSSAVPAAWSHQPAPALHCLGQTGTGGTNSGHLRGQLFLSHRPLHCSWAQTFSCVYLSECDVQDVNHCHKNDSLCFELVNLRLNHWIFIGFSLQSEISSQLLLIRSINTPPKYLLLRKLSSLSSLSSHWKASSPFLTSYHVFRCNNIHVVSYQFWDLGMGFQISLRNIGDLNLT